MPADAPASTSSNPLRILHVISSLDARRGGTTAALLALVLAQIDARLRVSVVSTFSEGESDELANRMRQGGADVRLIGPTTQPLSRHPQITPPLEAMTRDADVVHIHALWEEIQHRAARAAERLNVPYLFTLHGMLDPWSLRQSRLKKQLYLMLRLRRDLNRAAAIHFTDETERDLTAPLKLRPPSIVERLIVDLSDFASPPPRGEFREKFPQVGDRPIVLFLSRLHPKKGLDLLLPAFVRAKLSDAVLVLAGPADDAYRAQLEAEAKSLDIASRVVFTGM